MDIFCCHSLSVWLDDHCGRKRVLWTEEVRQSRDFMHFNPFGGKLENSIRTDTVMTTGHFEFLGPDWLLGVVRVLLDCPGEMRTIWKCRQRRTKIIFIGDVCYLRHEEQNLQKTGKLGRGSFVKGLGWKTRIQAECAVCTDWAILCIVCLVSCIL